MTRWCAKESARPEMASGTRSYHKLVHGKAPPPKVVAMVTDTVTPVVTVVTPQVTPTVTREIDGPKRDRAEYMRKYRANRN